MNYKNFLREIIKVTFATLVVLFIGYLTRSYFGDILLADEPSIGYFWAVFGSIYAFITAFILITVWGQFIDLEDAISREAKGLISIWNGINYLNDVKATKGIKKEITAYVSKTLDYESKELSKGKKVKLASKELESIVNSIDKIKLDDKRDPIAFRSLMEAYQILLEARSIRTELSAVRIPPHLKMFYTSVSFIFLFSYALHGFNDPTLYYLTLGLLAMIVSFSYIIIDDLDNYFVGMWNINFNVFEGVKDYIKKFEHQA